MKQTTICRKCMTYYHEKDTAMARLPNLNGLKFFEATARHLSVGKAAAELNVTQTAVSHQLSRLQRELGLDLLQRNGRGVNVNC
jgi:LysR family transcriptional regulator, glycine cleavage system transcriptional activator